MMDSGNQSAKQYKNRVREERLRAGVARQRELAKRAEIHAATLSLLENNRLFLSSTNALRIRDALGCRLDDLFEEAK